MSLRVHDHQLAAALHGLHDPVAQKGVGVGHHRVVAPDDDALRRHPVGVVLVARLAELAHVGHPLVSHDHVAQRVARNHARVPGKEAQREVWPPEIRILVVRNGLRHVATGAHHGHDGFGTILFLDAPHLLLYEVVGLVPRDALPRVLAAVLARSAHGVLQAPGAVHHLGQLQAAHAQAALREGAVRVALHLHQLAVVVGVEDDLAALVAPRARPHGRAGGVQAPLVPVQPLGVQPHVVLVVVVHHSSFRSFVYPSVQLDENQTAYGDKQKRNQANRRHANAAERPHVLGAHPFAVAIQDCRIRTGRKAEERPHSKRR